MISETLRRSPFLVATKRWIERHVRGEDAFRILEAQPAFVPNSDGTATALASLTTLAAGQIFPLLVMVPETAGSRLLEPIDIRALNGDLASLDYASELKELFDRYGSDKSTWHDYHLFYGHILGDGTAVRGLLEIGLGTNSAEVVSNMGGEGTPGASLRAFRDYLPNASIYGADIDRRILFSADRIQTCWVDQTVLKSFESVARMIGGDLDIVIDDGLHAPNANVATLLFAIERLRVGGWIVIEDIRESAVPIWRVVSALMPDNYQCVFVRCLNGLIFAGQRMS